LGSRLVPFITGETDAGTPLTEGLVGPRATLDAVTKGNDPCSCRGSNTSHPARRSVTTLTQLPQKPGVA